MASIDRLLVANRGEIAVRIIRAARELGITTIAAHSDADEQSLAVQLADESVNIGAPHARKSYLNHEAILAAARDHKADGVHPGYGFLSENADFARAVTVSNPASSGWARTPRRSAGWATRPRPSPPPAPRGCPWCPVARVCSPPSRTAWRRPRRSGSRSSIKAPQEEAVANPHRHR